MIYTFVSSFVLSILWFILISICILLVITVMYIFYKKHNESFDVKMRRLRGYIDREVGSVRKRLDQNKRQMEDAYREIGRLRNEISRLKPTDGPGHADSSASQKRQMSRNVVANAGHPKSTPRSVPSASGPTDEEIVEAQTPTEALIASYNPAIHDRSKKEDFEIEYNPRRLSVSNAMERQVDLNAKPVFAPDSSGTYWLVEVDDQQLLLPLPTMKVKDRHRKSGALDEVFQCSEYQGGDHYVIDELVAPAELTQGTGGNQWHVSKPGRIKLKH